MSAYLEHKLKPQQKIEFILAVLAFALVPYAQAEIILDSGLGYPVTTHSEKQWMSSIVMVPPSAVPATNSSYMMQRSLSWSAYRRHDNANTGLPLVYVPAVSGTMSANSPRQANVRAHVSRANAYRLGYFEK